MSGKPCSHQPCVLVINQSNVLNYGSNSEFPSTIMLRILNQPKMNQPLCASKFRGEVFKRNKPYGTSMNRGKNRISWNQLSWSHDWRSQTPPNALASASPRRWMALKIPNTPKKHQKRYVNQQKNPRFYASKRGITIKFRHRSVCILNKILKGRWWFP